MRKRANGAHTAKACIHATASGQRAVATPFRSSFAWAVVPVGKNYRAALLSHCRQTGPSEVSTRLHVREILMSTCDSRRRVRAITTIALPRQFWLFVSARMIDFLRGFDYDIRR